MVDQAILQTAFPHLQNVPNDHIDWYGVLPNTLIKYMADNRDCNLPPKKPLYKYQDVTIRMQWLWVVELITASITALDYIRTNIAATETGETKKHLDILRYNLKYLMSDAAIFMTAELPSMDSQRLDKFQVTLLAMAVALHRSLMADAQPPFGIWRLNDYMLCINNVLAPFADRYNYIASRLILSVSVDSLVTLITTLFRIIAITTGEVPLHATDPWLVSIQLFVDNESVPKTRDLVSRTLHWISGTLPFTTLPVNPTSVDHLRSCLTTTSIQVAKTIVDNRSFSDMPILADTLQDAGYDDEEELKRLRNPSSIFTIADRQLTIPLWSARLP